jgi:hypothetical protein
MGIPSVTETSFRAAAPPPAHVAPAPDAEEKKVKEAAATPVHAAPAPAPPPPPPSPVKGFAMDVEIDYHEATGTKIYNFVDPDSGDTVVQIPIANVLNLVASILQRLEAEGQR